MLTYSDGRVFGYLLKARLPHSTIWRSQPGFSSETLRALEDPLSKSIEIKSTASKELSWKCSLTRPAEGSAFNMPPAPMLPLSTTVICPLISIR